MKYGIRKEEKSKEAKRKWKIAMEDEIRSLKFEVFILKEHIQKCEETIRLLSKKNVANQPSSTLKDCEKTVNPFNVNDNNNNNVPKKDANQESANTSCSFLFGMPGGTRRARYRITNEFPYEGSNATRPGDRMHCITAMPEYVDLSLEELRLEDYKIAGPQHHEQFINYGLNKSARTLTGTGLITYRPTWIKNPDTETTTVPWRFNCITFMPSYKRKSFEELRLEDYILKSSPKKVWPKGGRKLLSPRVKKTNKTNQGCSGITFTENSQAPWPIPGTSKAPDPEVDRAKKAMWNPPPRSSEPAPNFLFKPASRTGDSDDSKKVSQKFLWNPHTCCLEPTLILSVKAPTATTGDKNISRHEELLNQVLSEMKKLDLKMSSMNCSMSTVDSNLLELNSRVSVMDSRLTAVDMFVTMQRFNEKWQSLEPRLASLESTVAKSDAEHNRTESAVGLTPQTEETSLSAVEETFETPSSGESFTSSSRSTNTSVIENKHAWTNTSYFSSECEEKMDISKESCLSPYFTSSPALKPETGKPVSRELLNRTDSKCDDTDQNVSLASLQDDEHKEKCDQNSEIVTSFETKSLNGNQLSETNQMAEIKTKMADTTNNLLGENSLNQPEEKILTTTNIKESVVTNESNQEKSEIDAETEFVMIEKSDLTDLSTAEESKGEQNSFKSKASEPYFTICNDITEYLEVNMGKKKDVVYEFGFEAKPDHSSFNELLCINNADQLNKPNTSVLSEQNDSFCSFVNQLVNSKTAKLNQSSPLVMTQIQSQDAPDENNPAEKKKKTLHPSDLC